MRNIYQLTRMEDLDGDLAWDLTEMTLTIKTTKIRGHHAQ
jgi:hypothetical protein